ncbi:NAD(P)/FAD-dependent oxidoreductase [Beggiatoa leptomitoformis]|uniref:FAD-dependent oxidoreductase n=1 Tax=Beggiatoa leptomitoformis TaxID=288004 RepID=A0A2N9YEA1_9GAMM|nr:NAD(P)/FAD-dependent oxidoreductase [Beggiatoa leptomitoformis]ALG68826.1 FAD-dependent oxidoreductase [Beggiatoa leptomitoformis]AUI68810.1 FAD-dependent oxidoreductase [Beggiatoa leptomitoformis]
MSSQKIAVIGAGPMGLMCAYELLKAGHQVDLYERDKQIGGMTASFNFDGLKIERYYHFICATDAPLFALLDELGLSDKCLWKNTKMGFFYNGKLYPWGNPLALLRFPHLSWLSKFRYALHVMYTKNIRDWGKYDKLYSTPWLKSWIGEKAYQVLWHSLFELKFFEYKDALSAAWIGTRIKRIALSRESLRKERLGYLTGGSDTLLDALENQINVLKGNILLNTQIEKVIISAGKVRGLLVAGEERSYDKVISTIPLPYVSRLAPDLPSDTREKIDAIKNIGVACAIFKLKQPLSENFWMNINDASMKIPGAIEYSNLNPELATHIVYVPFYMPQTHPKYHQDSQLFIDEVLGYFKQINPAFQTDWVLANHVSRYEFAQVVCPPNFYEQLPAMKSDVAGFFMADTSYYYPEDRSISESVKIGKKLAELAR